MMTRTQLAAAGILLLALGAGLSGCTLGSPQQSAPQGANHPSGSATAQPAAQANPKFGEAFTWADGVSMTVSAPTPFAPGQYAMVEPAAAYIYFTVTLVNGSNKNLEPFPSATLQSGNHESAFVADSENGLGVPPTTTLLPGREVEYRVGFGVDDPNDLVLEIAPGFGYEAALFTS